MTTTGIIILFLVVLAVVVIAMVVINYVNKKEERENALVKYVLLFDKKTKKFSEQRSDEFESNEDEEIVTVNDTFCLHSFNRFCAAELYHITTTNQAKRVFDIYLKSRINNLN